MRNLLSPQTFPSIRDFQSKHISKTREGGELCQFAAIKSVRLPYPCQDALFCTHRASTSDPVKCPLALSTHGQNPRPLRSRR